MTIHIARVPPGFVVSEDGSWLDGVYASDEAARFAVSVDPGALSELWQSALSRNPDALLTLDDLQGAAQ